MDFTSWSWTCEAVDKASTMSNSELLTHRAYVLKSLLQRSEELKVEEESLHQMMDPIVADVNRNKRLILLDELGNELNHPDHTIVKEKAFGFELVGLMSKTDQFESHSTPMAMLPETLDEISKQVTERTIDRVMSSRDPSLDERLINITRDEVAKRWLSQEVNVDDIPAGSIVNPRFAIKQNEKGEQSMTTLLLGPTPALELQKRFVFRVWMRSYPWPWSSQGRQGRDLKVEHMIWILLAANWLLPPLQESIPTLLAMTQRKMVVVYIAWHRCHSGLWLPYMHFCGLRCC